MAGFLDALHTALGRGSAVIATTRSQRDADAASSATVNVHAADPNAADSTGATDANAGFQPKSCIAQPQDAAEPTGARDDRALARQLAAALDRAVELGQWELAERIAAQSIRIAQQHPLLAERLARLRATRSDFDTALAIIDSCRSQPASMRLLRVVCLLQLGRRGEAHSDLHRWAGKASAPLQARLMLALLEWQFGDDEAALAALQHNLRQIEDPHTLAALVLMAQSRGRSAMAVHWAQRLQRASHWHAHSTCFEAMLLAQGFGRPPQRAHAAPEAAATLATELLSEEHVIPALVEAQRLSGEAATSRLLAEALHRAIDDVEDQPAACSALADLHQLLGEDDQVEAWRARGLAIEREQAADAQRDDVLASIGRDGLTMADSTTTASPYWEQAA